MISAACPNADLKWGANSPPGESNTVGPNPAPPHHGPAAVHDRRLRQLDEQRSLAGGDIDIVFLDAAIAGRALEPGVASQLRAFLAR